MSIFKVKQQRTNVLIDWLQVYCIGTWKKPNMFDYETLSYGNNVFHTIMNIFSKGSLIGTIAFNPRSSVIDQKGALIKLNNNMLYCSDYCSLLNNIMIDFGYEFQSISRLDLAIDFNNFNFNLHPEQFIKNYLTNKYTKLRKNDFKVDFIDNSQIIVKAIEKYYKDDNNRKIEKQDRCVLHGRQRERITYETLRFGNNNSSVSCYLYNKTAEMLAKKHKEYIRENWINHKLDVSKDVWRLEISIKGNTWKFVDVDNGEIRKLDLHDLRSILNLESIYFGHLDKYFDFRYNKPQVKRTRLKKITLFDKSCDNAIFMMAFKTDESNRMDKIFIRMLEKYNCQLRESKREYKEQLSIIVKDYSYDKGLTGFYNKIATQENQFRKDLRIDKQISDNLDTHYKKAE